MKEKSQLSAQDKEALEKSLGGLKTFDWGTGINIPAGKPPEDQGVLAPIDAAVVAAEDDLELRKMLEGELAAVLKSGAPAAAKDYACRKLMMIGTAESVPALASLLPDKDLSHKARYALERIQAAEAAKAMRDALPKLPAALKVGVAGSLGVRRDAEAVPALVALLRDGDKTVACAAAAALGMIGTGEAGKALSDFVKAAPEGLKAPATDASLAAAEQLLADGKKADALAIYKSFTGEKQPKHVRLAATRGMLAVAGKKD